jgi:hypothetical protein
MGFPVALPSPPSGQPAVRRILASRLRLGLDRAITLEPGDDPAYWAAGSVLITWGFQAANALFHLDPLSTFLWLTSFQPVPVWTVLVVGQLLGFASRSSTARAIATLSTSLCVVGLASFYLPHIPPIAAEVAAWSIRSATVAATVLWSLRTLRRWLGSDHADD